MEGTFPTVSIYADKRCERTAAEELPTGIKAFHFINIHRLESETLFLGPLKLFSSSRSRGEAGLGWGCWSWAGDAGHHGSWCPSLPALLGQVGTAREQPARLSCDHSCSLSPTVSCHEQPKAGQGCVSGTGITSRAGSGTQRLGPHLWLCPSSPHGDRGDSDTGTLQTASATAENWAGPSRLNSRGLKSCFLPLQIIYL